MKFKETEMEKPNIKSSDSKPKASKSLINSPSRFSKRNLIAYAAFFAIIAGGYAVYSALAASVVRPVEFYTRVCATATTPWTSCSKIGDVNITVAEGGSHILCNTKNESSIVGSTEDGASTNKTTYGANPNDAAFSRATFYCPSADNGGERAFKFMSATRSGFSFAYAQAYEKADLITLSLGQGGIFKIHSTSNRTINVALVQNAPPASSTNRDPIGTFDSITSSGTAQGWTCDLDSSATPLSVHFYVDGPAGTGTYAGLTTANITRDSTVASICGGHAAHGFAWKIPAHLRNGVAHTVWAHAINAQGGNNPAINGSPKNFTLYSSLGLSAAKTTVVKGSSTTLSWKSEGTHNCKGAGGWSGSKDGSSSTTITPSVSTTFIINCSTFDYRRTISKSVTINVQGFKISNSISPLKPCKNSKAKFSARVVKSNGASLSNAYVTFKVYYKTKTYTYVAGKTNSEGKISKSFKVGNTSGYKVKVKGYAKNDTHSVGSTTTYFTPKKCG